MSIRHSTMQADAACAYRIAQQPLDDMLGFDASAVLHDGIEGLSVVSLEYGVLSNAMGETAIRTLLAADSAVVQDPGRSPRGVFDAQIDMLALHADRTVVDLTRDYITDSKKTYDSAVAYAAATATRALGEALVFDVFGGMSSPEEIAALDFPHALATDFSIVDIRGRDATAIAKITATVSNPRVLAHGIRTTEVLKANAVFSRPVVRTHRLWGDYKPVEASRRMQPDGFRYNRMQVGGSWRLEGASLDRAYGLTAIGYEAAARTGQRNGMGMNITDMSSYDTAKSQKDGSHRARHPNFAMPDPDRQGVRNVRSDLVDLRGVIPAGPATEQILASVY